MTSNCSCKAKHQKAHLHGCSCGSIPAFIGQMPSGSPLPDPETLSNLSDEMIEEIAAVLEPADLLELCRRCDHIGRYCKSCEIHRKRLSREAVYESDEDMVRDFYQANDADLDMLMVAVTNGDLVMLNRLLESENYSNSDLGEVLVVAATQPQATKILERLLNADAPVHYSRNKALRSAVLVANPTNALFLIQRGSPVIPELLADAVATRKADIVQLMLNEAADPNVRVNEQLPIESAALDDQWHIVKLLMNKTDTSLLQGRAAEKIRGYLSHSFKSSAASYLATGHCSKHASFKRGSAPARRFAAKSAALFKKAQMEGATYVSIENMENILNQIRQQKVNLPQAIANGDPEFLQSKLQRGKFTINDLLADHIYLAVGASGNVALMEELLKYKDPAGEMLRASQLDSPALDAVVLSKNPELIDFVFNQFTDDNGDRILVEQLDQKTLLTAAMAGFDILKSMLEWRDKNGRGFTVNDIINSGLLEKLIERGDQQSLNFLLNQFTDYAGRQLTVQNLLSNELGPMRALVSSNNPEIHRIFQEFQDHGLEAHHFQQAASLQERYPGPVAPPTSPAAFHTLVSKTNQASSPEEKEARVQHLASVIETHGSELAEAISESVTKNIEEMIGTGSATFDSGTAPMAIQIPTLQATKGAQPPAPTPPPPQPVPTPLQPSPTPQLQPSPTPTIPALQPSSPPQPAPQEEPTVPLQPSPRPVVTPSLPSPLPVGELTKIVKEASEAGAEAAFKMQAEILQHPTIAQVKAPSQQALKTFLTNVDSLAVAQALAAINPKDMNQLMQGKLNPGAVGTLLMSYAGQAPTNKTTQWARAIGNILAKTTASSQMQAQMPPKYDTFSEQVEAAFEDLKKYPDAPIKLLAKKMQVKDCEQKTHDALCREVAKKIIYVHSDKIPSTDNAKCSRYTKKLSSDELDKIRNKVYKEFRKYKDSVTKMSSEELHKLFKRYDELCFDGDIQSYMKNANYSLRFKTSGEDTFTTEGICTYKVCDYTVTIPTEYFGNVKEMTIVAGHPCKDQLECLLRVIEHELVHLIIFMFCGDPFVTDQHGPLFMNTVRDLFGHTDHRHYIF